MRDYSYALLYETAHMESANYEGHLKKRAARDMLHEQEQSHEDEIKERHHKEQLEQGDKHHAAALAQQERQFRETIRAAKTNNRVAIVAALAAIAAAYFAGESVHQSTTSPSLPSQPQLQSQKTPSTAFSNTVPSAKSVPSPSTYPTSGQSLTASPAPAPKYTPQ
jgi:hypothetical protein